MCTFVNERFPNLKRGNFSSLDDKDIKYFNKILEKNQVITDAQEVQSYNVDWLKICTG